MTDQCIEEKKFLQHFVALLFFFEGRTALADQRGNLILQMFKYFLNFFIPLVKQPSTSVFVSSIFIASIKIFNFIWLYLPYYAQFITNFFSYLGNIHWMMAARQLLYYTSMVENRMLHPKIGDCQEADLVKRVLKVLVCHGRVFLVSTYLDLRNCARGKSSSSDEKSKPASSCKSLRWLF